MANRSRFTRVEKTTLVISILAILISLLSLYFQFFYKHNSLIAGVTKCEALTDSTITLSIIFQNQGNQYETVLYSLLTYEKIDQPSNVGPTTTFL
jgi:hypothetical protein